MSITYQGAGTTLTPVAQAIASVPIGGKSSNVVHVNITNGDNEFRRKLVYWLKIQGGRNLFVAEEAEVEFGQTQQFSGITLMPGETLVGWSETLGLIHVVTSTGSQK